MPATYRTTSIVDADPRKISNLISDQSASNPAAALAAELDPTGTFEVFLPKTSNAVTPSFSIPNVAPDAGLSASFNSWFTMFGQFFDHGLDLVNKGGNGVVFIPLAVDDPLYSTAPGANNFMLLTRATNILIDPGPDGIIDGTVGGGLNGIVTGTRGVGADGILGNGDDVITYANPDDILTELDNHDDVLNQSSDDIHLHNNQTSPWIDQNQTYTSHPAHQAFLREYVRFDPPNGGVNVQTYSTGKLLDGPTGGLARWMDVKSHVASMLGLQLVDNDVLNIPLIRTDLYGQFVPGAVSGTNGGYAQYVMWDGVTFNAGTPAYHYQQGRNTDGGLSVEEANLLAGQAGGAPNANYKVLLTNHAFLDDIAHSAAPGQGKQADLDDTNDPNSGIGLFNADGITAANPNTRYDNELLDRHFITGDGRGNENIGLTAVHTIFHSEHNRLVDDIKSVILATGDDAFIEDWLKPGFNADDAGNPNAWDGERLFQAARFVTEMEYQHIVFEEFGRKVQPGINLFAGYDPTIDPAIVGEFAHTVYRFGHSMLTDEIMRFDGSFNADNIGLLEGFLNPLEFNASGATTEAAVGAIVRGMTRQVGSEIDEFVVSTLRNNLVGLPLDLPALNIARGRDTGVPTLNEARSQFYNMTGDAILAPYASWVEFAQNAKHELSVVNFIAAYGQHELILAQTTLVGMRDAALSLVTGTDINGVAAAYALSTANPADDAASVLADRLDFLNSTGAWTAANSGLNRVDFWIGGLAEKQIFGSMLGATFAFVFETQMEQLQNADRFYYLARLPGMNFASEIEANSFADLIMRNSDLTRLPADVFSTPTYILEVNKTHATNPQFNMRLPGEDGVLGTADDVFFDTAGVGYLKVATDGADLDTIPDHFVKVNVVGSHSSDDPTGTSIFNPLVVRTGTNYLKFTGEDHVVLGGTANNDTMIGGIGDDALYGDGGNDFLDGGDGADAVDGGDGHDRLFGGAFDDVLFGKEGNDVLFGGLGLDILLGGFGDDYLFGNDDLNEVFGGMGDDLLRAGAQGDEVVAGFGNDWMDGSGNPDILLGDSANPLGNDPSGGHDVLFGGAGVDDLHAEGGEDIMIGSINGPGPDFLEGQLGFDWATYMRSVGPVEADLGQAGIIPEPVPGAAGFGLDIYIGTEGLSGSRFNDILRGDDLQQVDFQGVVTPNGRDNVLVDLGVIAGYNAFNVGFQNFIAGANANGSGEVFFNSGNMILGGDGSDLITGMRGNDIIDGDRWLNVYMTVTDASFTGMQLDGRYDYLTELQQAFLDGTLNPGDVNIVREIVNTSDGVPDMDTAVYRGLAATYTVAVIGTDATTGQSIYRVTDNGNNQDDIDVLYNIERIQFADITLTVVPVAAVGAPTILDATVGNGAMLLSASGAGITDANNVTAANPTGAVTITSWQWQAYVWDPINLVVDWVNQGGPIAAGATFAPESFGLPPGTLVRVIGLYTDGLTGPGAQVMSAMTAIVGDGFANILDGTSDLNFGFDLANVILGGAGDDTINGGNGNDVLNGGAGNDTLNMSASSANITLVINAAGSGTANLGGLLGTDTFSNFESFITGSGNDTLTGNAQNNTFSTGAGNDTIIYTITGATNSGADVVDGGTHTTFDTLTINGSANAVGETLDVLYDGASITHVEGGAISNIEVINVNLLGGGADTLSYTGSSGNVVVNLTTPSASGFNTILGVENATGGSGNDTLTGSAGANVLAGGLGNDTVSGAGGDDIINYAMGDGADTVDGGAQAAFDTLNITGAGADSDELDITVNGAGVITNFEGGTVATVERITANLGTGTGADTLRYSTAFNLSVNLATQIATGFFLLSGVENVFGGTGNDTITGGAGVNVLDGGGGNDVFNVVLSVDADTIVGGAGTNFLNITGTGGNDTLDMTFNGSVSYAGIWVTTID